MYMNMCVCVWNQPLFLFTAIFLGLFSKISSSAWCRGEGVSMRLSLTRGGRGGGQEAGALRGHGDAGSGASGVSDVMVTGSRSVTHLRQRCLGPTLVTRLDHYHLWLDLFALISFSFPFRFVDLITSWNNNHTSTGRGNICYYTNKFYDMYELMMKTEDNCKCLFERRWKINVICLYAKFLCLYFAFATKNYQIKIVNIDNLIGVK